jgi:ubiquinone/menaquinone biosynthesis C-methylase UbiE
MIGGNYKRLLAENFDARSLDYNANNFHGRLAERVVALAGPQPGDGVLDVATGTGLAALAAARLVGEGGRVVGVDLSPGMLAGARRAVEAAGVRNVDLVHADAESQTFPAASFDAVVCVSSLPYLTDIPAALMAWHGFLKPGGRVAFNCWSEGSYITGFLVRVVAARHGITMPVTGEEVGTPDRCRAVLTNAGFVDPDVVVDPTGQHFVPLDQVEKAWDGWVRNPVFHPRDPEDAAKLLGLRDEYLTEARSRATDRGVRDEMTAYYVVGRKP